MRDLEQPTDLRVGGKGILVYHPATLPFWECWH